MLALGFHRGDGGGGGGGGGLPRGSGGPGGPGRQVTLAEFSAMMKGEETAHGPLEDVWSAYRVLSRLGRAEAAAADWHADWPGAAGAAGAGAAAGEWAPITLEGLQRACRRFDVRLGDEELRYMVGEGGGSGGGVGLRRFAQMMGRSPWF